MTLAPLAVFEVLSPDDTVQELYEKLDDYTAMGIPQIWVVDPKTGVFKHYVDSCRSGEQLRLPSAWYRVLDPRRRGSPPELKLLVDLASMRSSGHLQSSAAASSACRLSR